MVKVDKNRCKSCGICIKYCPKDVFDKDIEGSPVVARAADCTQCGLCVMLCPDFAITVKGV